ncbi:MAG: DUF814 domain-containing protein [Ignavibacteriales bacterium]|nr:DUF814 domain-containing protein [Ignavibacteriales bacterium]
MIANYYTLLHIAHDLNAACSGLRVEEIFCQNKNELLISFEGDHTLVISCEPAANYVMLRNDVRRAKKNSLDVFKTLWGKRARTVVIQPADREIVFELEGNQRLAIQLFGSKANVLFLDTTNCIAESFLRSKEIAGTTREVRPGQSRQLPATAVEFQTQLQTIGNILVTAALKKFLPLFGSMLIRELCYHCRIQEQTLVAGLNEPDIHRLYNTSKEMIAQLEGAASPRIYFKGSIPITFSIIPLDHLGAQQMEHFDSLHDAIRIYIGKLKKQQSLVEGKEPLLQFLQQGIERAERTLKKMAEETQSLERAAQYETMGKLLMANLYQFNKGMKKVELENVFGVQRDMLTIPIEANLTPVKNAERYFEKAKKARASVEEKFEHREEIEERWELLRHLNGLVGPVQTIEQFNEFMAAHADELARAGYKTKKGSTERIEQAPFRIFTVTGGFEVWAGKSSENNDLLTMKYAKPSDLWFHARGSSGSHVILRIGTGKGEPSKRAIEEAAGIAAYYSKMKTAKNVPVAVTEKKYVRKPKGAPAGTVTIEREKLLFVEPKLPGEAS